MDPAARFWATYPAPPRSPDWAIIPETVGQKEVGPQVGARPDAVQKAFHTDGYWLIIHSESSNDDPAPSERTTGTMGSFGSLSAGLSAAMAGLSQLVISPVKILAMFSPESLRLVTRWPSIVRLYMNTVPPAVIGM